MDRYLSIKLHPSVGAVIVEAAKIIKGDKAMQILKRVVTGYTEDELKQAATHAMERLQTSTSSSPHTP